MIKLYDFNKDHIEEAQKIALINYNEERSAVTELPPIDTTPSLEPFADNGLGVAAFDDEGMLGFLCCHEPWEKAFNSIAKGTFSPIHAHGAVQKKRDHIYKRLYQAAAEKWIGNGITCHAIGLYTHDTLTNNAFFSCEFGLRCIDAIRSLTSLNCKPCTEGISFGELAKKDVHKIREMRRLLSLHLSESPCFMRSTPEDFQKWISRAESRDSRVFIATHNEEPVAFMEVKDNGENFITETRGMKNICGAFCLPEYRGKLISQGLLDFIISRLKDEGYKLLGVDFESFNPTASGFWLKYFTAYTSSVIRKIN